MGEWRQRRANQIVLITLALLGGVVAARLTPAVAGWLALVVAAAAVVVLRRRLGVLVLAAYLFGAWRGAATEFALTPLGEAIGRTVTVSGVITDDPAINDKNQVSFTLAATELDGRPIHQNLQVMTTYKTLQRGYRVAASGKLRPGLGATPAGMFGTVTVLSDQTGWLERQRQRFFTAARAVLPEPTAGFGLGLLIGVRALIPKPLQHDLSAVGLSHLVAVSGYNLTIIIQAARRVLAPLSYFAATAASLWLIFGFMLVAGFSASIVRAALVSGLGLLIGYYGYEARPITLVALPAAITVAWRPDYLLGDLGWQLSFLAFFGIVVLAPLMQRRWVRRPTILKLLLLESLAAQIMTAPLILGVFGNLSLVSPLANAVVLPMVPLAMMLSLIAGLAGLLLPAAAGWIALPAIGLLGLVIGLVQWWAGWPGANLQLSASAAQAAAIYGLIAIATVALVRRCPPPIRDHV